MTPIVNPIPSPGSLASAIPQLTATSTPTPIPAQASASIHGPYEDLGIAALQVLLEVVKDMPADAKSKAWENFTTFMSGMQSFASKADVFHLFTGAGTSVGSGNS